MVGGTKQSVFVCFINMFLLHDSFFKIKKVNIFILLKSLQTYMMIKGYNFEQNILISNFLIHYL